MSDLLSNVVYDSHIFIFVAFADDEFHCDVTFLPLDGYDQGKYTNVLFVDNYCFILSF